MEIRADIRLLAATLLAEEIPLREGADVVARVVAAPPAGGRGLLSLAGALVHARVPAGLREGQELQLRVEAGPRDEVVLRLRPPDGEAVPTGATARTAGTLALSGDGKLVQVANELQQPGFALPLPSGDALELKLPDGTAQDDDESRPGGGHEAGFVLHSAEHGPIEVRLTLAGGAVRAEVRVALALAPAARAAAPELADALATATGVPAGVGVEPRAASAPPRPLVEESLDRYA